LTIKALSIICIVLIIQSQSDKEVHIPFRKTLENVARVGMRLFTDNGHVMEREREKEEKHPKMAKEEAAATAPKKGGPLSASMRRLAPTQPSPQACQKARQIAHYVEIRGRIGKKNGGNGEIVKAARFPNECMDACDGPGKLAHWFAQIPSSSLH
jgi:hypothetical protein